MHIEQKRIIYATIFPLFFILTLWVIKILETELGANLYQLGIYPLKIEGLPGIITEPLIHSGYSHLLANTFPLFILGWTLFYFYVDISYRVFFSIWVMAGLCTWILGRPGWHIGASGLIYGFVFFLFLSGIIRRNKKLIAVSLMVIFLYGSIIWNMTPLATLYKTDTSWEGHLSGGIAGIIMAIVFRKYGPQSDKFELSDEEDECDINYMSDPENEQTESIEINNIPIENKHTEKSEEK